MDQTINYIIEMKIINKLNKIRRMRKLKKIKVIIGIRRLGKMK